MPLKVASVSADELAKSLVEQAASTQEPQYVVVYASLVRGKSWCPDCQDAEPFVNKKFAEKDAHVVYAGGVGEWRTPSNQWRQEPFNVTNLPTIVKVTSNGKWHRLVESDVYNQKKLGLLSSIHGRELARKPFRARVLDGEIPGKAINLIR